MHLEATRDLSFSADGHPFAISKGQTIHTETVTSMDRVTRGAAAFSRLAPVAEWTDREGCLG